MLPDVYPIGDEVSLIYEAAGRLVEPGKLPITAGVIVYNVETMYNIIQDKVEASEFIVKENSPISGVPLKDLRFKENVLVASIFRKGTVIIPHGSDVIEAGDAVVIVTKHLGLQDVRDVLR